MSVEEHKDSAAKGPFDVAVLVVSSSRTESSDESGKQIAGLLSGAGHRVVGPTVVDDDKGAIQDAVVGASADAVILTGGTGLTGRDVTPEAMRGMVTRQIPGFGELFRYLSFQKIGSAAMMTRASAGLVGNKLVFSIPGSPEAVQLALEALILLELPHLLSHIELGVQPQEVEEEPLVLDVADEEEEEDSAPKLPPPSGGLGRLGRGSMSIEASELKEEVTPSATDDEEEDAIPDRGWKRAVYELQAEVIHEKREELPEPVEKLAPFLDVLYTSGEQAVLKLPSGRKYSLWGWPDLRRDGSKVIAVGWGDPLAEVIPLHRYPVKTGTCLEDPWGLLPTQDESVEEVCEAIVGRAPKDTTGVLFAIQGDAVWIQRGYTVFRWDGRREVNDGTPKQVLSSLTLHWSNR
jgi:molybdopterin adenylyltransferase